MINHWKYYQTLFSKIKFYNKKPIISKLKSLISFDINEEESNGKHKENNMPFNINSIINLESNTRNNILNKEFKICIPTNILVIKNIITIEEVQIDEEYNHIYQDVKQFCEKLGELKSLKIPRLDCPDKYGITNIYLQYEDVHQARYARKLLKSKLYKGRIIDISYLKEEDYLNNKFKLEYYNN